MAGDGRKGPEMAGNFQEMSGMTEIDRGISGMAEMTGNDRK